MSLYKRLKSLVFAGLIPLSLWTAPVQAAGTIPLALAIQYDTRGNLAPGCQLYTYQAGTVATLQDNFSDFGLTAKQPNPLTCDQSGRVPMLWLADGLIHIRLTDSSGVVIVDTTMQVLGPSSGSGGGGGTVDPTSILATGDLKFKYGTGSLSGFVRVNGLTIGDAISGATERANADTQALFIYLYTADANLVVSGGRTGNALNDYNANKTIALPDWRDKAIAALGDMGNTDAGLLTSTYFGSTSVGGCTATTLGCAGGGESHQLTLGETPTGITSTGSASIGAPSDQFALASGTTTAGLSAGGSPIFQGPLAVASGAGGTASVTSNNTSGNPHVTVQPTKLTTFYIKL